jgi:hypothetical protein
LPGLVRSNLHCDGEEAIIVASYVTFQQAQDMPSSRHGLFF